MKVLLPALRELAGLFVDDGALVLKVVAVVAVAAVSAAAGYPLVAGGVLLVGCLGVLFADAARLGKG